jgi:hypothetical protein
MKIMLHLKGGPGSGHHGHGGRPGQRGGSTPGKGGIAHRSTKSVFGDMASVPSSGRAGGTTKAYFIFPDGDLIDASRGSKEALDHEMFIMENPEIFGLTNAGIFDMMRSSGLTKSKLFDDIAGKGIVRVRTLTNKLGRHATIDGLSLTNASIQKIQDLILQDKLPNHKSVKYVWLPIRASMKRFSWKDIMLADAIRDLQ